MSYSHILSKTTNEPEADHLMITDPDNLRLGLNAGVALTTGTNNTLLGVSAGQACTTGTETTAVGFRAAWNTTTPLGNTACGSQALRDNITGAQNSAFGVNALQANLGTGNSAFGENALNNNTSGLGNAAFGCQALTDNLTGNNLSAFGFRALANALASNNSAFGQFCLNLLTSGIDNTAMGDRTGDALVDGNRNTLLGARAESSSTSGNDRTAVGYLAEAQANFDVQLGQRTAQTGTCYFRTQQLAAESWNDTFVGLAAVDATGNVQKNRTLVPGFERFSVAGGANNDTSAAINTTFVTTTGAGNATGTLADGTADGMFKKVVMVSRGGTVDYQLTVTNGTSTAGASITRLDFTSTGQSAVLVWDTSIGSWFIAANNGVTVV